MHDNTLEWNVIKNREYALGITQATKSIYLNKELTEVYFFFNYCFFWNHFVFLNIQFAYAYNNIFMNLIRVHSEYLLSRDKKTLKGTF